MRPALRVAALFAGCAGSAAAQTPVEQPFETVLAAANSGIHERRREVVRDEAVWARVWAEIHGPAAPARPAVDFSRHMLIVVASGTRRSGGHAIRVRAVAASGDRLAVTVVESCPPRGAMVTMALTQPVEVVRVPRFPQPPRFEERREPSCP
jgi:hypothetical protein